MKRTDLERMERELRRRQKKERLLEKRTGASDPRSARAYTNSLFELFQYDDIQIYNTNDDEQILELLMSMKEDLPEKQWEAVIKKAVRMTKVAEPDAAVESLRALMDN